MTSDTDADPNWKDSTWSTSNVVTYPSTPGQTVSGSLGKIQTQPKYIVEDMGENSGESGGSLVLTSSYKSKGNDGGADHRPGHGRHRRRPSHAAVHLFTRVLGRHIKGACNGQTRSDIIPRPDTGADAG